MTIVEVCSNVEAETHAKIWAAAAVEIRQRVIAGYFAQWEGLTDEQRSDLTDFALGKTGEPVAAKKVIKRKPRKTKPLTQHAGGLEEAS